MRRSHWQQTRYGPKLAVMPDIERGRNIPTMTSGARSRRQGHHECEMDRPGRLLVRFGVPTSNNDVACRSFQYYSATRRCRATLTCGRFSLVFSRQ